LFRQSITYLGLAALAAAVIGSPTRGDETKKLLNVLFLFSDDLRPELETYGHPIVKTPNINALAASGVRFDRAYCQFPLCNPSRSSMLNGRYPLVTGVLGNGAWFGNEHPDYVSLPKLFKNHGYFTLRSGKVFHGGIDDADAWTEGGQPRRFGDGSGAAGKGDGAEAKAKAKTRAIEKTKELRKGEFVPSAEQEARAEQLRTRKSDAIYVIPGDGDNIGDGAVATRAIEQLRRHKDEPFFLACGFSKPHSPPEAPQRFFDLYEKADVVLPPDFAPRPTPPPGVPPVSVRTNTDLFINRDASVEEARKVIRAYWAALTWVDYNVGRVIGELDRLGLRNNTVIVFWGDHGYHLGEKGRWSKAGSLFEVGARVPLIIAAPKAAGNGRPSKRIVEAVDIYRTLADLTSLPIAEGVQGHSLAPLLTNPDAPWDHPAYTVWAEGGKLNGVSVRDERFRYAEWDGPRGGAFLYDLDQDPHELKNLADDPAFSHVRQRLSSLVRHHRRTGGR
jgi:arylsulfatase A-like enzyme